MQKFLITIIDDKGRPITTEWLQFILEDMDMELAVTEIPQPPFASGMDVNSPYPSETLPKDYKAYTVRCGVKVWGTPSDIDSGIRHHMDTCEKCQSLESKGH